MKRPLAIIGFSYLFTLVIAAYLNFTADAALVCLFLLCAAVTLFGLKFISLRREVAAVFISAAVAMAAYCVVYIIWYQPALALDQQQATVSGTVVELPSQSGGSWYYIIKTDKITVNGKNKGIQTKIRLKTDKALSVAPFDRISLKAQLYAPPLGSSGGFDSRSYYRSKGIYLFANALDTAVVKKAESRPPYYYAIKLREYISGTITKYVRGDWGALAAGILIGDISNLPAGIKSDFSVTGISHILAVSGTQTSLITEYVLLLLCALRLRKRPAAVGSAAAVVLFIAVTGFSPSVMRAGIMSLIFLGGMLVKREADAMNSLGLSVLLLCIVNPFAATDVGLLLSFSATLGMITVSKRLTAYLAAKARPLPAKARRLLKGPAGLLCETIGASLLTYPVIMLTFGQVSVVALASNLLEVPVSLFVTLAAAVIVLLEPLKIFVFLIKPIAMLIRFATAFMIWYAHILAMLPFAAVSTSYGFIGIILTFALIITLLYFLFRGRGASIRVCVVCICFTLAVAVSSYMVSAKGVLTITALPIQGGSCTVLISNGRAMVYDMGGSSAGYQAAQYLKSRGIRQIDVLIMPVYDRTRVSSANELMSTVNIDKIYIPGAYKSDENPSAVCVSQPSALNWQGVSITMIPDRAGETMIALITYGSSSAVLTGGASADLKNFDIAPQAIEAGAIVFGGNVTRDFAKAVSPQIAVEGSDNAAYGGAIFESLGCKVHDTGVDGRVSILTRGSGEYMMSSS